MEFSGGDELRIVITSDLCFKYQNPIVSLYENRKIVIKNNKIPDLSSKPGDGIIVVALISRNCVVFSRPTTTSLLLFSLVLGCCLVCTSLSRSRYIIYIYSRQYGV